jgi:trans-2,3-dihydro-3-hydroxyanthranilate isomerase
MTTYRYRFTQVDVFTDRAFGGNQLAVLPDARGLRAEQMQTLAREMNYAESTFVFPPEPDDPPETTARVRIFTPAVELPMAGHPTIGTAYVLANDGAAPPRERSGESESQLVLLEGVGPVPVALQWRDGRLAAARMTQPRPRFGLVRADRARIAEALGLTSDDLIPEWPAQVVSTGVPFLFVPLRTVEAVGRSRSDGAALAALFAAGEEPVALHLFALGGTTPGADLHVRMFAPHAMGIAEDPATGAAAGALGAYLMERAWQPSGSEGASESDALRFVIEQGIEMGRPSRIEVAVRRAGGEITTVEVGGQAVLVGEGTLTWDE